VTTQELEFGNNNRKKAIQIKITKEFDLFKESMQKTIFKKKIKKK